MKKFIIPVILIIIILVTVFTVKIPKIEAPKQTEITGKVESPDIVDVRPRIEGFLEKIYIKEGSFVKKGDLLFTLEPEKYKLALKQARVELEKAQVSIKQSEEKPEKPEKLEKAKASLAVKQVNLEKARMNFGYTKIYAKISGKIGKIKINAGNAVSPEKDILARIISLNPIYVSYNISSEEYLKFRNPAKKAQVEIMMPDGSIYPFKGQVVFYDNEIDSATGTINVRAEFKNPDYILVPGQEVRVIINGENSENTKK